MTIELQVARSLLKQYQSVKKGADIDDLTLVHKQKLRLEEENKQLHC